MYIANSGPAQASRRTSKHVICPGGSRGLDCTRGGSLGVEGSLVDHAPELQEVISQRVSLVASYFGWKTQ